MSSDHPSDRSLATRLVHSVRAPERSRHAVVPIHRATVWTIDSQGLDDDVAGAYDDLLYPRYSNTDDPLDLGAHLADLESAESGLVTASGMSAISASILSVVRSGGHLLAARGLYGGTHKLITRWLPEYGVEHDLIDASDPASWSGCLRPDTKAIYVETIGNPLMNVADLEAVVAFARTHGMVSIIDNTFATPLVFRPIEYGFDLVVHSATKALNGHSDVLAGVVLGSRARIGAIDQQLRLLGGTADPQAVYLLRRGVKTLGVRLPAQNASALELARRLQSHPGVASVSYPGLSSHPDHQRAKRLFGPQDAGFGHMIAIDVVGGWPAARRLLTSVKLFLHAPSLGGLESLAVSPAKSSHAALPAEERRELGIGDGLVRLSIGIEDVEDLWDDLYQALPG
ncbi:MAG: PLP-dependent aspartate aminotransferase family protein [Thermoanaerobaculia bacterium]|nr:PLP-dependent aspartate aminotransferase family protein [Thermoanaerobaculia bacterium]